MPKAIDLTGQTFGRWTVLTRAGSTKNGRAAWLCRCVCGTEKIVAAGCLRDGKSKSCGCLNLEKIIERNTTHGMTGTRLYGIWTKMVQRTTNEKDERYEDYGGRGITMCEEWRKSFEAFKMWAVENGYAENLTIDRINNDRGYSPDNCRWVTKKVQMRNTRRTHFLTFRGETKCITDWAEETGISRAVIDARINRLGWSVERALTTK